MTYNARTTETELVEFLNTAITESGCPGEQWAMIALKTYGDLHAGKRLMQQKSVVEMRILIEGKLL